MSIVVPVVELLNDGEIKGLGDHEFQHLPSPNDRVVVAAPSGDLDIMRVVYVEHSPIKIPRNKVTEDEEPTTTIYVEFAGRYTGE